MARKISLLATQTIRAFLREKELERASTAR
jgi:hypothetical protein